MGLRDLGATRTLGRVGAQSKPEGISATLGNPCREVRLLQGGVGAGVLCQSHLPSAHTLAQAHPLYLPFFSLLHLAGIQVTVQ